MASRSAIAILLLPLLGCAAEPLGEICPEVSVGELVITEVSQSEAGTLGQWLELYNAGPNAVDLAGLHIDQFAADGSNPREMIVRESVELEPGSYVALGRGQTDAPPGHVAYAFGPDLESDFHGTGFFEVRACDVLIDGLTATVPEAGTLAQDGAMPPSADADPQTEYCNDTAGDPIPGSPGEANPPCP